MIKKLFYFFFAVVCFWSCKAEKVQIPAYIEIDGWFMKVTSSTQTNDTIQGTNNQKFTDMEVFVNGQSYGTFPIGKPIPVLASGLSTILIRGVIEVNGVSALRADYELMNGCDTILNLTPGKTTKIIPVFEYYKSTYFAFKEDFEEPLGSGNGLKNLNGNTNTTVSINTPGLNSPHCLALKPVQDTAAIVETVYDYSLPSGGVGVYLEFNYKGNTSIRFTLVGKQSGAHLDLAGAYASANWNKLYLDMTEQVSNMSRINKDVSFYLIIYSIYDPSVGANQSLIDNIKLVTRQ